MAVVEAAVVEAAAEAAAEAAEVAAGGSNRSYFIPIEDLNSDGSDPVLTARPYLNGSI